MFLKVQYVRGKKITNFSQRKFSGPDLVNTDGGCRFRGQSNLGIFRIFRKIKCFDLRVPLELDKKNWCKKYLLLEIRRFPGSFGGISQPAGTRSSTKLDEFAKFQP